MPRCVLLLVLGIVFQMALSNGIEFNVTQDGKLCLYASLTLKFSVDYKDLDDETQTAMFPLPDDVKSDESTCDKTLSTLKLNFGEGNSWSMTFSKSGESYQADMITFTYNLGDPVYFPNSKSKEYVTVTYMPEITNVGVDTCYSCKSEVQSNVAAVSMMLSDVLIQAFISDGMSSSITGCAADQSVIAYTTAPTTTPSTTTPTTAPTTTPSTTTPTTAPTTAPNTTTPTTAPTTAPNTTTTTTAPTTAPNTTTTTTAPTTAPNTTTTTTTPSTTTMATPATTPVPTLPVPTTGNYSIKIDDNSTACLLANFGLRIGVKQAEKLVEINFDPIGANVSGSCGVNSSELVLGSRDMTINFTFTNDTKKFRLHALNVRMPSGQSVENTNLSLWEASVGSSYMCNKEQTFNITDTLIIYTFSLHVQPFGVQKGVFSTAQECSLDDTSILVPIIVGAALAGLILIVVIAYVIGRRKTYVGYQTL